MRRKEEKVMQREKKKKDGHWSFSKRDPVGPGPGG
jgi:hypothetical protein